MTSFVAVYRGETVANARLVAVSADPVLVADVSTKLLRRQADYPQDPVIQSIEAGRREALRLIEQEAASEPDNLLET